MAIFVSYRREDSESITGRIDDHLRHAFGEADVYRDIDSIPPGIDFVEHLQTALSQCDICVAVIGQKWLAARLEQEADFVRLELETVLDRGVPIIPVLVERGTMPSQEQLPSSLRTLVQRQAVRVDSGIDFKAHAQRLVEAIRKVRELRAATARRTEAESKADQQRQAIEALAAELTAAKVEQRRATQALTTRTETRSVSITAEEAEREDQVLHDIAEEMMAVVRVQRILAAARDDHAAEAPEHPPAAQHTSFWSWPLWRAAITAIAAEEGLTSKQFVARGCLGLLGLIFLTIAGWWLVHHQAELAHYVRQLFRHP